MRYLIQLAYNGRNYHGWQKQHNAHTVQDELDLKLSLLLGENIETLGCGRTDTGVHAKTFYAHFDSTKTIENPSRLVYKLNQVLPDDIAVYEVFPVPENFNARFDAAWREYEYHIVQKPDPFLKEFAWYQYGELDITAMNKAAAMLLTHQNFECFSKVQTEVKHFNCDVMFALWTNENDRLIFTIRANRFLRNMVRAIVGTLTDIGRGKTSIPSFEAILNSSNRSEAGQSVPARGLFLTNIYYPELALDLKK